MLKLQNLEKFYNKNRNNEIHVINDINLELPQTGLVVLLGPSGSGKTTLLNVLGGLDKLNQGVIDFDGTVIDKYRSSHWDDIRNEHVGYIFQNYNLLNNLSVYDNIAMTLNMVGIIDKEEIDNRIDYILSNIGMINYRRRKAGQLSGGQQQRVAIARALAKNPKVIIADEPTGNLDSKNTYDIMNILRNISKTKLVVLVTHEENIASLYADRIIRLKDGQIVSDVENKSIGGVDVQLDTDIYLKDLNAVTAFEENNHSFQVFSDEKIDANFNVRLIVKNKTLYVQVDSNKYKRVNLLDHSSEVKIFDAHYENEVFEEFTDINFDLDSVIDESKQQQKRAVISTKEAFKLAFNRFKDPSRTSKFIYAMFIVIAGFVAIAISMIFNVYSIDPLDFMNEPLDTVSFKLDGLTFDEIMALEDEPSIGYYNMAGDVNFNVVLPTVFQRIYGDRGVMIMAALNDTYLDSSKIIYGDPIAHQNELVLNKVLLENMMENSSYQSLGITSVQDFLNIDIEYEVENVDGTKTKIKATIVGIIEESNPVFYAKEETIWMMKTGIGIYDVFEDDITLTAGTLPLDNRELIVRENDLYIPGTTVNSVTITDTAIEATGTFTAADTVPDFLVNLDVLKEAYFNNNYVQPDEVVSLIANDVDESIDVLLADYGIDAVNSYKTLFATYRQMQIVNGLGTLMFGAVFLGASSISAFFILRSSLLSRIYEVSIYRALGAKKRDLIKIFLIEALILTVLTSLIGYVAVSAVVYRIQLLSGGFFEIVKISPLSFITGIVLIFITNILSGIIPVTNLLTRTPSEILSKYDF